jgi:hypothetical protein
VAKQNQIPTTVFVPPFPTEKGLERDTWNQAVAGFCNGGQSVKNNNDILSLRFGNMVYFQGEVVIDRTIEGYLLNYEVLPVAPRTNGFVSTYDTDGNVMGIKITSGSKSIDFTDFADGTYYVTGSYIANIKEKL